MPATIMIVDDSRTMRDMLHRTLEGAGYLVVEAVDGKDGLERLSHLPDPPEAIISDINMPNLDGYGFISGVRSLEKMQKTPILVLTTETDPVKKERAKQVGATGWIVKPFAPAILLKAIERVTA
ncbi:response regulator [Acetobacter sp.]|uniref:response regulator n=1 Tax=Acetobacter sp. TaxID=440 RepID=UPI0025C17270|nr:response regulator [Acetobacter sp.]MCH4091026.1 response regulator [Acetobacter sp.]MCI1300209.1 response regulator [Acetobacter sp.]MCI1316123.1 response regulator [Acetobacter sp.]